ncbi:MAG: HD domain-containing protein [Bacteroidales bacterium]|nr:HD domain-containing protein [Bacteroidales bacterium]
MKNISAILVLIFLVSLAFCQSFENGVPGYRNFSPRDYGQESQNFSVIQNKEGLMYFGNANGIMEFDNNTWRLVKVAGKPILTINSKNEIYFGGYNEIGKIIYENGLPVAKSLNIEDENKIGQVRQIIALENDIYAVSSQDFYYFHNDSLKTIKTFQSGIKIFEFNNKVLCSIQEKGLFYWTNGNFVKFEHFNLFEDINICDLIILNSKEFLVIDEKSSGIYKYSEGLLTKFETEVDDFIQSNVYSSSVVLDDNRIVIGTEHGGIVCIDKDGHYLFSMDRDNGLRDNQITSLFVANDGNLWVTSFSGISLVETKSNISFFGSSFGFNGVILSVLRHNSNLYIGTSNGVYLYNRQNIYDKTRNIFNYKAKFKRIEEIRAMCWNLVELQDNLYAVTSEGIYKINETKAKLELEGDFYAISKMSFYPNNLLIGSTDGLLIASIIDSKIDSIGYLQNYSYSTRTICEDYFGYFWLGTNEDGLFQTSFFSGLNLKPKIKKFSYETGLPKDFDWVDVFPSFQGVLFATNKGVFRYNYNSNYFIEDTLFNKSYAKTNSYLYPLVEDKNKNIWYSNITDGKYERETGQFQFEALNSQYKTLTNPFSQIKEFVIERIYPEDNGVVWLGSSEALIKINNDESKFFEAKPNILIRKITVHGDSLIYLPFTDINSGKYVFKYSDKTIRFDFTALNYNSFGQTKYQLKLIGFDNEWSDWSNETFKEYTSLLEGNYEFQLRAKDEYGNISDVVNLHFSIRAPVYRTWYAFLLYFLILVSIVFLLLKLNELRHARERYSLEKLVEDRTNELAYQKEQTEQLVKKLLPKNTADELRETGKAKSHKYEMVTVLFADIQGFTEIAEQTKPEELIKHLNNIFTNFDKIIAQYNIEKIKTIGDAYMCAGGMPNKDNTNPVEVVLAALEMQRKIIEINNESSLKLGIRIGVHTGAVVAGVVGSKKLEYDIWGDTVNIASRMESHGLVNKVNISETTYKWVKDFFVCQYRGKIDVKYKGEMEMYFVHEIKKRLSQNADKITPSYDFFIKMLFLKYEIIQENILELLEKNLPTNLYYHNLKHTRDFLYVAEEIGREEGISEEDMLLLKCASLFHDAGFMVSYDNNEEIGAKMAAETLEKNKFSPTQIETVKRLIMATKMPPRPKDLLEKIMCDADLDYLGRPDFIPISQNLFRELFERGKINTIDQWNKMQYKFIKTHNYFTLTARKNRDAGKQLVLKELEEMV